MPMIPVKEATKGVAISEPEVKEHAVDLLIVGGTSLVVYPAAGLIRYRSPRCRLALLNRDATDYDRAAGLVVRDDLTQVLWDAVEKA